MDATVRFSTNDILTSLNKIEPVKQMKVAAKNSINAGLVVGGATTLTAMALGRPGIVFGALLGTCVASYLNQEKPLSVVYILLYETTSEERESIANELRQLINHRNLKTIEEFISKVSTEASFLAIVINVIKMFVTNNMGKNII